MNNSDIGDEGNIDNSSLVEIPFPDRKRQSFGISSARDLLAKIERELSEFEGCTHFVRAGDHAFNLCLSLWHMTDWAFADMTPDECCKAQQFLGTVFNKPSEFSVAVQKAEPALKICRIMATASKHVEVTKFPEPSLDTMIDIYAHATDVDAPIILKWGVSIEGASYSMLDVFKCATSFWTSFFVAMGWPADRRI
ncbi:hypothetical protein LGM38_32400 [Burkholderia vietnamiensis]|uniref:hypothetical protein n=1 Tax=Burkholderia vietnamiensis TaxID=60552 RepID=UPI001CF3637D|nr:hypothetical protein [Burkholderia vietnamiensis]MCA8016743.1 hypothetical protein [Burkholderia vietnamiensis]